jgi:hypothetical protein
MMRDAERTNDTQEFQQGLNTYTQGLGVDTETPANSGTGEAATTSQGFSPIPHTGQTSLNGQALAKQISSTCSNNNGVQQMTNLCRQGEQSACYRAAALTCECYLDHDARPLTAQIQQVHQNWQQCVSQNTGYANSLRSNRPGFGN